MRIQAPVAFHWLPHWFALDDAPPDKEWHHYKYGNAYEM